MKYCFTVVEEINPETLKREAETLVKDGNSGLGNVTKMMGENNEFIMVKDSPLAIKIDKIPVVYSLDTANRRIFIKNIEFADYNGDGVAKNFLSNAGVTLEGFDKEVLRQVEQRLI